MTPTEVVRQHCDHLVRRLTSKSPLLRFKPASTGRVISPHDLFGTNPNPLIPREQAQYPGLCANPNELLQGLLRDNKPVTIAEVPKKARARCLRLINTNRDFFAATGNWQLYFAYPFVHWQVEGGKPYWSPLFFWKVRMRMVANRLTIERLEGDNAVPIFNRMLAAALKHFEELSIDIPAHCRDEDIEWQKLPDVIREILGGWHKCEMQRGFTDNKIERFIDPGGNAPDASLHSYAALGCAPFTHQSILEDLDRLSKCNTWDGGMGCMGILVSPAKSKGSTPAGIPAPDEEGKYIVAETDPSQERAIWKARNANMSILQGPPGTGKSQTIVNLIADALRRGERVAVVCHQQAALSVVKKRLDACGLGDLALLITSPQNERKGIITDITKIGDGGGNTAPLLTPKDNRSNLCRAIENQEKLLDGMHSQFRPHHPDAPPAHRYGALRAIFDRARSQTGIDIFAIADGNFSADVRHVFPAEFGEDTTALRQALGLYIDDYKESDYGNHPWHIRDDAKPVPFISAALDSIRKFFDENCNNASSLHRIVEFAENPLLLGHYAGFSPVQDVAGKYAKTLANAQKNLSGVLSDATISQIFGEFRESGNSQTLEKCRRHLGKWTPFLQANKFERENAALVAFIATQLPVRSGAWMHFFDAAVAWKIYEQLPKEPPDDSTRKMQQAKKELAGMVVRKRQQDARIVADAYNQKVARAQDMGMAGLLIANKKGSKRKTQLRDIYHDDAGYVFGIYPALLATPDAACQMIPLKPGFFDLLVIDEASQVFTSDALPMLYRAKRAIISGDEMQMPPADIFTFGDDGADDDGDGDTDDTGTKPKPNRYAPADGVYELLAAAKEVAGIKESLSVHYRSEARKLIDYSNHAFYDGILEIPTGATKALPFMDGRPINLVHIDNGEFSGGINRMEIRGIIRQLRRIWSSAPDAPKKYSVGVIVFNTTQRNALLDELEKQYDAEFRDWLEQSQAFPRDGESFFVRSVEHVQGDERDIIIMGTTYGKDKNFYGPINIAEKGRRRLNVAVTRAKQGMIVVSSLDIGRIANDSDRGKERWFFWKYMQYARAVSDDDKDAINGVLESLSESLKTRKTGGEPENEFEAQVGEFIRSCGYEVEYQVGESGFRIDIGVKKDGDYVCGVECDGAPYHSGWRARHRDIWRQGILVGKGWNIARVWSTDWFHDKEAAQDKLKTAIAKHSPQPQAG